MPKHLQVSIAEPCHENWDEMTPASKGRFCDSCQKQVVDFSNMSDRQVAEFFKKPSTGSVCGRFMQDQLERDIEIPRKRIPWLKYFFQFMIPAFLLSIKATAQGKVKVIETAKPVQKPVCTPLMGTIAAPVNKRPLIGDTLITSTPPKPEIREELLAVAGGVTISREKPKPVKPPVMQSIIIKGKVVDEDGEPIPQATIQVADGGKTLIADAMGIFSLKTGIVPGMIQLEVSSKGYETEIYNYPFAQSYTSVVDITIRLKREIKIMDEVVIKNSYPVRYIMGDIMPEVAVVNEKTKKDSVRVKNITAPKIVDKTAFKVTPIKPGISLVLYPNPVSCGQAITISFREPEEGYYQIQLLSEQGQLVHQKQIAISRETVITKFEIPFVAAGSYVLVLTNTKSGKRFSGKIIVQ